MGCAHKSCCTGFSLKRADVLFLLVIVASVVLVVNLRGSRAPADVPAMFSAELTLPVATQRSAETGQPVLVYATASWCGPCQSFKRGALSDPEVERAVLAGTLPVYLDIDEDRESASMLGVRSVPMLIVIRDGAVVGSHVGAMSAAQTVSFVREHAGPVAVSSGG